MHIHGGHMNPSPSLNGAHGTAAARRAEETRKKLFAKSSELDAASGSDGGWMVTGWAGGISGANQSSGQDSGADHRSNSGQSSASMQGEELPPTAPTRPVSFWA